MRGTAGDRLHAWGVVTAANQADAAASLASTTVPLLARWIGAPHAMLAHIRGDEFRCLGSISSLGRFGDEEYGPRWASRDPVLAAELSCRRPVVRSSSLVDYRWFRRTELYDRVYRHNDASTVLLCKVHDDGADEKLLFALMRGASETDFTGADEQRLELVRPSLAAAARRAVQAERERAVRALIEALLAEADPRPRVVLDARGRTLWASPRALALLGGELPRKLARVPPSPGSLGATPVVLAGPHGPVRATIYKGRGGGAHAVALLHDLGDPSPRLRELATRAGLTPAETRVLAAIDLGMDTRCCAAALFVSVHTVRTHVKRVLAKLGVHTRSELKAALLRLPRA